MSMILDALKRAKEEGDSPVEVPSIDSTQELTVKEPPSTNALKYLAFGIGLGVLITAGVLVTRNEPPAPDSAVAPQNEKVILPKSISPPAKALPRALEPARPVTTGNDRTQGSAQNRTQVAELYRVAEDTPLSDSAAPALTVAKGSGAPPVSNPPDDAKSGQLAQSSASAPNSASSVPLPKVPSDSDLVSMATQLPGRRVRPRSDRPEFFAVRHCRRCEAGAGRARQAGAGITRHPSPGKSIAANQECHSQCYVYRSRLATRRSVSGNFKWFGVERGAAIEWI